jgi:hypothetical protein
MLVPVQRSGAQTQSPPRSSSQARGSAKLRLLPAYAPPKGSASNASAGKVKAHRGFCPSPYALSPRSVNRRCPPGCRATHHRPRSEDLPQRQEAHTFFVVGPGSRPTFGDGDGDGDGGVELDPGSPHACSKGHRVRLPSAGHGPHRRRRRSGQPVNPLQRYATSCAGQGAAALPTSTSGATRTPVTTTGQPHQRTRAAAATAVVQGRAARVGQAPEELGVQPKNLVNERGLPPQRHYQCKQEQPKEGWRKVELRDLFAAPPRGQFRVIGVVRGLTFTSCLPLVPRPPGGTLSTSDGPLRILTPS